MGSFVTLSIYAITIAFLIVKLTAMIEMSNPNVLILTKNMVKSSKDYYGALNLTDTTANIAVAIADTDGTFIHVPPEIGQLLVVKTTEAGKEYKPLVDCQGVVGKEKIEKGQDYLQEGFANQAIKCIDKDMGVLEKYTGDVHNHLVTTG